MSNETLVSLLQKGIDKSENLEKLYLNNKGMISKLAYRYCSHNDYDDLMQEGFLALENAAYKYDPAQGIPFHIFALIAIRYWMIDYTHRNGYCVRIPEFLHSRIYHYKRFITDYQKEHGSDPDDTAIMHALNITLEQLDEIKRVIVLLSSDISIDEPVSNETDDITYADIIPDPEDPIDEVIKENDLRELESLIWKIIDDLKGKHQPEVLRMRFKEGKTLRECGKCLGIEGERVRVIQNDGLKHIRQVHYRKLLPYYHEFIYQHGLKHTGFSSFKYTNESSVERTVRLLEQMSTKS